MSQVGLQVNGIEVEHFCVKVDVIAYVDPLAAHSEIVVHNNWAQSNFSTTWLPFGSPSVRQRTGVSITNTLPYPAIFSTVIEQTDPHFRICLGNAWLRLQPNETRMVEVLYESLAGDPIHGAQFEADFEGGNHQERANQVGLTSCVMPSEPNGCFSPHPRWGAGLSLRAGRATRIENVRLHMTPDGEFFVGGIVIGTHNGTDHLLDEGYVNMILWYRDSPSRVVTVDAAVESDGRFAALLSERIAVTGSELYGEAFYIGTYRWAPSRSGRHLLG